MDNRLIYIFVFLFYISTASAGLPSIYCEIFANDGIFCFGNNTIYPSVLVDGGTRKENRTESTTPLFIKGSLKVDVNIIGDGSGLTNVNDTEALKNNTDANLRKVIARNLTLEYNTNNFGFFTVDENGTLDISTSGSSGITTHTVRITKGTPEITPTAIRSDALQIQGQVSTGASRVLWLSHEQDKDGIPFGGSMFVFNSFAYKTGDADLTSRVAITGGRFGARIEGDGQGDIGGFNSVSANSNPNLISAGTSTIDWVRNFYAEGVNADNGLLTINNMAHFYVRESTRGSAAGFTNQYGLYIEPLEVADNNYGIWIDSDAIGLTLGTTKNVLMFSDGTNAIINTSNQLKVVGNLNVTKDLNVIGNITGNFIFGHFNKGGNATSRANNVSIQVGTLDSGNIVSVQEIDGNSLNISEVTGTPGYDVRFNFTNLTSKPRRIEFVGRYDGSPAHTVDILIYNFSSNTYVHINTVSGDIVSSATNQFLSFMIEGNASEYISDGVVAIQILHSSAGNINHDLFIDFITITVSQTDLSNVGQFVKILNFTTTNSNGVDASITKSNMSIKVPGLYRIETSSSFVSVSDSSLICSIFKNDVEDRTIRFIRTMNDAGDIGSAAANGMIRLAANDFIDFRCSSQVQDSFVTFADLDFYIERKMD